MNILSYVFMHKFVYKIHLFLLLFILFPTFQAATARLKCILFMKQVFFIMFLRPVASAPYTIPLKKHTKKHTPLHKRVLIKRTANHAIPPIYACLDKRMVWHGNHMQLSCLLIVCKYVHLPHLPFCL